MEIRKLTIQDEYYNKTIEMANHCSWGAGPHLARRMKGQQFSDFECPFVAIEKGEVVGYCTLTKTDFIPNCPYTPWIGFVFVDEHHRGKRISQQMIQHVLEYAKQQGFKKVYLSTEEENLYEKYDFVYIDTLKSDAGTMETILMYDVAGE
jgi:predicted N-acetyltransferase YhbS